MNEKNLVKHACEVLGLTQAELAKKIGASKPTVERWAQSGEVSDIGARGIELLLENEALKQNAMDKMSRSVAEEIKQLKQENEALKLENQEIKSAIQTILKYSI